MDHKPGSRLPSISARRC